MNSESVNGESRSGRVVGCSLRCASPALILALGRRWDGADGQDGVTGTGSVSVRSEMLSEEPEPVASRMASRSPHRPRAFYSRPELLPELNLKSQRRIEREMKSPVR